MEEREKLMMSLVESVALPHMPSVLGNLQTIGSKLGQGEFAEDLSRRLIQRWAEKDVRDAFAWVQQLPMGVLRQETLSAIATEWANTSLSEAVVSARQLSDSGERQMILGVVANEAVRLDPVVALSLATELPQDAQRNDLVRRSAAEWALANGTQAAEWARQIEDIQLRGQVLASIATALGEKDPVTAATLAVTEIPAGRAQSDAVIGIVERWAQQQPEQAAAWVQEFPHGELKTTAADNLVAIWSLSDSQKAVEWRSQMMGNN